MYPSIVVMSMLMLDVISHESLEVKVSASFALSENSPISFRFWQLEPTSFL